MLSSFRGRSRPASSNFGSLRRFCDNSGNVAVVTGLMLPLILAVVGFAMDFAYVSFAKQKIDKAAEAAVIAAVSQSAATASGGYANRSQLKKYGSDVFEGNIAQLSIGTVTNDLTVVSNGQGGVNANISYSANVPTFFSGIIGINTFSINGSTAATATPATYINYYILVDASQSMGIASTAMDMTNLYNRVVAYGNGSGGEAGCVFGCHVKAPGQKYSNEYLAHNISPYISLRIDSAVTAIQNIIADAATAAGTKATINIGLYTISKDPVAGTLIKTIASPSSNYAELSMTAASITLGNNTSGGAGDSDFSNELSTFNSTLSKSGSGENASSPQNYVFIVTDGLSDVPGACASGHCTGSFSSSYCSEIKTKATVGVIYTTYLPIYNKNKSVFGYEGNYAALVLPKVNQIAPNLQACATSSQYYFEANDGPGINNAMKALFATTQQAARLTQ